MTFTSFEETPMVNTSFCHICFGTGKSKIIQQKMAGMTEDKKKKEQELICIQCEGRGFILAE